VKNDEIFQNHLFVKYFLCENVRDLLAHRVRPDDDLHAQRLADEVSDGVQLVGVEVDGHQQQHFPKRSGQAGFLK
jgi:hypothetical protein